MSKKSIDVLVVDDEKSIRDMFEKHLGQHSLEVAIVDRVQEAISLVKKKHPKVVIVDLFLPELDGFDLADQIFKLSPESHMVLMSGIYDFTEQHLRNLGIEDFVKKPIDFSKIDAILRKKGLI